jgi:adenine phosphoribosyltransferase
VTYDLEYGTDTVAVHADALWPGARVLIVDDILATGGTVAASIELVQRLGGHVAGVLVVAELSFLHGRDRLAAAGVTNVQSLIDFEVG